MKCDVIESYSDYVPPVPVAPIVRDLIRCVKPEYLAGLASIVITNSSSLSREERRRRVKSRNHKVLLAERRGFYQPASHDQEAYIQLKADMIIPVRWIKSRDWFLDPLRYRLVFARVLYHEIGHHIHFTQRPKYRGIENVAEKHMHRLLKRMLLKRWYLYLPAIIGLIPALARELRRP